MPPSDEGGGFAVGEDGGREQWCLRRNIGQDFACPAPVGTFGRQKYPKPPGKRDGKSRRFPRTPPRYVQRTQGGLLWLLPKQIRRRACGAIRQTGCARTGSGGAAPLLRGPPAAFGDFWGLCLRALPGAEEASKQRCSGQRRVSDSEQAALGTANWIKSHNWVQGGYKPCPIIRAQHTTFLYPLSCPAKARLRGLLFRCNLSS